MGRLTHRTTPGWTYFVTSKTWQNRSLFQVPEIAEIVVQKMLHYRNRGAYLLHDFVVMPNHIHLILTPSASVTFEKAVQLIKGSSSHEIHLRRGHKMQLWQSGFHESAIHSAYEYAEKARYIHLNPLMEKLVKSPDQWNFGSASGSFRLDPIPQGLKPPAVPFTNLSDLKVRPPETMTK